MYKYLFLTLSIGLCTSPVNSQQIKAKPFPPGTVKLLEGPFKQAMEKDLAYLLSLEPDRFLHRFHENAGLPVKAPIYGGWEALGVSGHAFGHYLSACAMAYTATDNPLFRERVDYIVSELARCQEKRGTGYVGGIPEEDRIFAEVARGDIRSAGFDLNGGWVPLYTLHKILAGLIDAYTYTGNEQAKTVFIGLCDWIGNTFGNLTEEQLQKVLACEHGGLRESLARVYSITGNKKYLELSNRFYHQQIMDPLASGVDKLGGIHANTQIPKVIGSALEYELTGTAKEADISRFFWTTVVDHHSYVIGGNSNYELFNQPDKFTDQLSSNTTETCNSYNMLKLTAHLFGWEPSARLMDYYERTLYNHILASIHPETGMTTYYVPLVSGGKKTYGKPFDSFWCCTGTGMENHVKYADHIFFRGSDQSIYINLFISSVLTVDAEKALKLETAFPSADSMVVTVKAPAGGWDQTIHFRYPSWSKDATVFVNGKQEKINAAPGSYISISRRWQNGDRISFRTPMSVYTEKMPDNNSKTAFLYGPLVLAAILGDKNPDPTGIPVLVTASGNEAASVKAEKDKPLVFRTTASYPGAVSMMPFYQVYDKYYAVYWDQFSPAAWKEQKKSFDAARKAAREIEKNTLDIMRLGEMQPERDHAFEGSKTNTGEAFGRRYRDATDGGWFSFELDTKKAGSARLVCTYWGDDRGNRSFDILVNSVKIASQDLEQNAPGKFFDVAYEIPGALLKDKDKITVRFQAKPGKMAGGVYGCRLVKNTTKK